LPYVEQEALFMSHAGRTNNDLGYRPSQYYLCPIDPSLRFSGGDGHGVFTQPFTCSSISYATNVQAFGYRPTGRPWQITNLKSIGDADFPDGVSLTIGIAERWAVCPDGNGGRVAWFGVDDPGPDLPYNAYFGFKGTANTPGGTIDTTLNLPQINPKITACNPLTTQTAHVGAMNVALMDGSVRSVGPQIKAPLWQSLQLPNDGQPSDTANW